MADLAPDAPGREILATSTRRTKQADSAVAAQNGGAKTPSLRQLANLPNERQLQDQIVGGLRMLGYTVLEVGRWVRQSRCPGCGAWHTPTSGHGNTPGTPDLFVSREGANRWVGLELKTLAAQTVLGKVAGGKPSREQRDLAALGVIAVVHSLEEALDVLEVAGL